MTQRLNATSGLSYHCPICKVTCMGADNCTNENCPRTPPSADGPHGIIDSDEDCEIYDEAEEGEDTNVEDSYGR